MPSAPAGSGLNLPRRRMNHKTCLVRRAATMYSRTIVLTISLTGLVEAIQLATRLESAVAKTGAPDLPLDLGT